MAANQRSRKPSAASTKKNITGKTSAGRKTTSTRRKTTVSRQQASRKNASSKSKSRSSSRMKVQEYSEPIGDEIQLIIILAVSILVLLSVFGIGGRVGDKAAYVFFGLFGAVAYTLPFLLFIGSAFHISNRGSHLARIKLGAAIVFLMMVMALFALSDPAFDGNMALIDGYQNSAASRSGGGIVGCTLSWLLFNAFGRVGTTVIFICIMLISGILITGKRLFIRIGHLIALSCSALSSGFASWRDKRAEERLLRAERGEYDDSILEDDEDFEEAEATAEAKPIRKTIPNIIIHKASNTKQHEDAAVTSKTSAAETSAAAMSMNNIPAAESIDLSPSESAAADKETAPASDIQPFTDEQLNTYDHGQPVKPLRIQIPEFMKPTVLSPDDLDLEIEGLPEEVIEDEPQRIEPKAVVSETAEPEPVKAETIEPIPIKAEALESEPMQAMDQFSDGTEQNPVEEIDISKILSEIPKQSSENSGSRAAAHSSVISKSAVKTDTASSGSDEPLEIVEEEIEKYEFPPLDLLDQGKGSTNQQTAASLKQTALKLQQTFESFGVGVQVTNVSCGPAVTRYELQPDQGVKVSRIVSLSDDIKLNLAVADIRIEAPIPGKAAVGIEVPNTHKEMVHLRDLLESDKCRQAKSKLAFAVGKDIGGQTVVADIEKMPHLLIAGATGSGKSVCINTIIMSILYRADPNEVKMIMIDPKVVELNVYNGLPHLLIPVVTDPKKAAGSLNWAVNTMMERYNKFAEIGAKDLKSYNARVENLPYESEQHKKMPQIIIIIDELADLMMVAQSEVEDAICRLAQLARAAGIHLVIATQRPSVNVITGLIKANVPSRIAFSVSSGVDSRTILDMNGAEKLLGNGDMLFYPQGLQKPVRVQGAFVSENEIARVTDFIKAHLTSQPVYSETIKKSIETASISSPSGSSNSDKDVYFEEAGRFIIEKDKASIGMLQRVYKIGFNRAARIMDQLCEAGVVGPEIGTKPRQIKMTMEEFEAYLNGNQ